MKKLILNLILVATSLPALAQPDLIPGKEGGGGNTAGLKKFANQIATQEAEKAHLRKYQEKFCASAREGFRNLELILTDNKIENPIFSAEGKAQLKTLMDSICNPLSKLFGYLNEKESKEIESDEPLIAKNYPATGEVKIHPERWDEKEKTMLGRWALQTLAVHEIVSLKPFLLEKTDIYTWSSYIWRNKFELENLIRLKNYKDNTELDMDHQLKQYATHLEVKNFKDIDTMFADPRYNETIHQLANLHYKTGQCVAVERTGDAIKNTIILKLSTAQKFSGSYNLPLCGAKEATAKISIQHGHSYKPITNNSEFFNHHQTMILLHYISKVVDSGHFNKTTVFCKTGNISYNSYDIIETNEKSPHFKYCSKEDYLKEI